MKNKIQKNLHQALLLDGKMEYKLYEFELEEHIAFWKEGLHKDKEDFVFILNAREGDVAMLLITKAGELYINEKAREQLKIFWKDNYKANIETLLPHMASELSKGILSVNGVKYPLPKERI